MSFDWKAAIGKVAPWLAGAFGTPAAGIAVQGLCAALGLEAKPENARKAAEMVAAGNLTGEQFAALKKAEMDFQLQMQAEGYKHLEDLEALAAQDRDSARKREMAVQDATPRVLAYAVVAVWALINGFLLWAALHGRSLPGDMNAILMRVLGTLDAALTLALSYYFGSSSSSRGKDLLLYQSSPGDKA